MRTLFRSVVCLGLLTIACGESLRLTPAPGPSQIPPPAPPFAFEAIYTQITVGEVVNRRVTADAPECAGGPWPCQHFRLTAPSDGSLEVVMTYSVQTQPGQGLDLSLVDSVGNESWGDGVLPELRVGASVKVGATYQITVWYTYPGVEFQLRTSLQ